MIEFWASWCGPCKLIDPLLKQLDQERDGELKVAKIECDSNRDLVEKYGVRHRQLQHWHPLCTYAHVLRIICHAARRTACCTIDAFHEPTEAMCDQAKR